MNFIPEGFDIESGQNPNIINPENEDKNVLVEKDGNIEDALEAANDLELEEEEEEGAEDQGHNPYEKAA